VSGQANRSTLDLGALKLSPGTHRVTATLSDPPRKIAPRVKTWTVDNTMPTATYTLAGVTETKTTSGETQYVAIDSFSMKLLPADDMPGYVVAEFQVDGDGWHHYYGWPDAPPGEPFHFTPRGTTIKELVYGSLSSEGLSPQPWEARAPGYGTHRVEYRARDAAGNIGATKAFTVIVRPSTR
jgi:hypothetical protein